MAQSPWLNQGRATADFGGTDLGQVDVITVRYSDDAVTRRTAETGSTPRGGIYVGSGIEVDVLMKESTMAQIKLVLPNYVSTSATETRVSTSAGLDTNTMEAILILKPDASAVTATHLTILRAVPQVDWEISFDPEGPEGGRMYKVTFVGHVVETASTPPGTLKGELFVIGNDT